MATHLTERLQTEFINSKYLDASSMEEELTSLIGIECECYDSGIYDGADDEENVYVLYSSFKVKGTDMTITFTYGDCDDIIGCVDVRNPIDSKEEKRKYIKRELENLVHKRFTEKTLTLKLQSIFNEPISLSADYEDKPEQPDWNYTFGTTKDVDIKGVFDIYYLEQRVKDERSGFYVTEVGYLFD